MGWLSRTVNNNGVYAFLTTPVIVNVVTSGVFVAIAGVFTNSPIFKFHLGTNAIVYDGEEATWFEMHWAATCSTDGTGRTMHAGISVNGAVLVENSPSVMGAFMKTTGEMLNLSGSVVAYLEKNATISLQLTTDDNNSNITVHHYTTTIRKFYR